MRINLPNQITIARLVLAVIFFVLLGQYDQAAPRAALLDVCFVIFLVAALTDWLDGYLARKQNQVTSLGRMLDPFVDKVLICGVFVFFCSATFVGIDCTNVTGVAPWMVVLIVGRELLVTGLRGFTESRGQAYGALAFGKLKMVLQSTTASVILLLVAHPDGVLGHPAVLTVKTGLIWATVIVTALSMFQYLLRSKDILTEAARV
ncbi:MAG: CDP-diacylglycerol--glycerol-3-phosphate 3-phosphatidyltransferase [Planctomycetes bacterium]|nr:CDP-diacylglycerol--glycerol-3-phosphate 3-phosphatidyltransferase [Planctomycetota bacterium]